MTVELSLLLKATAILAVGLAAARLTPRARASVRHLILACTFGALLGLPIVAALAPAAVIEIPVAAPSGVLSPLAGPAATAIVRPEPSRRSQHPPVPAGDSLSISAATVLRVTWAAGAAMFLIALAGALWSVRRMQRFGLPWIAGQTLAGDVAAKSGVRGPATVLLHEDLAVPVTCGLLRSVIVLPRQAREWPEPDLRRAFVHELEHVRRKDWLIQLVARAICAVYWFHPLVWIAWRQLRLESERACDDAVVRGTERTDYAEQLVLLAERLSRAQRQSALAMASRSDLSVRVTAVLDQTQLRGRAGAATVTGAVFLAAVLVALVAPIQAVAVVGQSRPAAGTSRKARGEAAGRALGVGLVEAAERGDVPAVTEFLDAGVDVNAAVPGDGSPLIVAAREGHAGIVRLLLDRGADPDLGVEGDGNPLIMAAREGHAAIVTMLLDRGANIDQIVSGDENALIQASGEGRLEIVKLLVSRGANVNARAWAPSSERVGEWRTPLSMARREGHEAVVKYLVSAGAVD
jgi:beta-lactamase regulating signal transducer with metallopeptidase domain